METQKITYARGRGGGKENRIRESDQERNPREGWGTGQRGGVRKKRDP